MKYTRLSICFKEWLNLHEVIDANTEKSLNFQKDVDPQALSNFINTLKSAPEFIDKATAFKRLLSLRSPKAEKQETPQDPFLLNYYNLLQNNQITKTEYNIVKYFLENGTNKNLLKSIMDSLRKLIQEGKIDLNFANNIPTIVDKSNNKSINITKFDDLIGIVHAIETQNVRLDADPNLADPVFLEVSHKEKLVAKSKDGKIWVFKATSPIDCRSMGKGQSWCIASSSSAKWYFHYRHEYGQTQYFIFDFTKKKDDPARYVNPGVAPKGEYSEWVDAENKAVEDENGNGFGINGYKNLEEYLKHLEFVKDEFGKLVPTGISRDIFKADPISKEEKTLKSMIDEYENSQDKNQKNRIFNKLKSNPALLDQFLQLQITLDEDHFYQLNEKQKKLYISNLSDDNVYNLLRYAKDKDQMAKLILQYKGNNLSDDNVANLLHYAKDKDQMAKLILQYKGNNLSDDNVANLLLYAKDKDQMAKILGTENINNLSDDNVKQLLAYAEDKDQMAKLILQYKGNNLSNDNVYWLLDFARDKNEMAKLIKEKAPEAWDAYRKWMII